MQVSAHNTLLLSAIDRKKRRISEPMLACFCQTGRTGTRVRTNGSRGKERD